MLYRLFCQIVFCALLAVPFAQAANMEFPDFSIDLPEGWVTRQEGLTTAFFAKDNSAIMQVTIEPLAPMLKDGITAKDLAAAYAEELGGSTPVMEDADPNYYSFTYTTPKGLPSEASIVVSGRRFYLITISGAHPDFTGMVESVLLSIQ